MKRKKTTGYSNTAQANSLIKVLVPAKSDSNRRGHK